jgi:hypothetical protein
VIVWPSDLHLPQLLSAALMNRVCLDVEATRLVRPEKVGAVGDAHGLLSAVLDRLMRSHRGERLDRRGVEAAVDEAPWLVVAGVGGDLPACEAGENVAQTFEILESFDGTSSPSPSTRPPKPL